MKKLLVSVLFLFFVTTFFLSCGNIINAIKTKNLEEHTLTYVTEDNTVIKTVFFDSDNLPTVEPITVNEITYEGFTETQTYGYERIFFVGDTLSAYSDITLKTTYIKSSYYELPDKNKAELNEDIYKTHSIYRNTSYTEFYDRDKRVSWTFTKSTTSKVKINYCDESNNVILTDEVFVGENYTVKQINCNNILYDGYYVNGQKEKYNFTGDVITTFDDYTLVVKWIKSSFDELPSYDKKKLDKNYYINHRIYKNRYNNEFYDADTKTTWITNVTNIYR